MKENGITVHIHILEVLAVVCVFALAVYHVINSPMVLWLPYVGVAFLSAHCLALEVARKQDQAKELLLFEEIMSLGLAIELGDPQTISDVWQKTTVCRFTQRGTDGD